MKKLFAGLAVMTLCCGAAFAGSGASASTMKSMPKCKSGDPVVWVTAHKVYYPKGSSYYGKTAGGHYSCKSTAVSMGATMSSRASGSMMMGKSHSMGSGSMSSGSMHKGGTSGAGSMGGGSMSGGSMSGGSMSGGSMGASPMPMRSGGAMSQPGVNQPGAASPTTMPVAPGPGNVNGAAPANGNVPNNPAATPSPVTSPH